MLGTVYAVGDEADEATLSQRLRSATWPDGTPVFTFPMVIGLIQGILDLLGDKESDGRETIVEDVYWALFNSPEFSWNH